MTQAKMTKNVSRFVEVCWSYVQVKQATDVLSGKWCRASVFIRHHVYVYNTLSAVKTTLCAAKTTGRYIRTELTPPELRCVQMLIIGALPTTPSPRDECLQTNNLWSTSAVKLGYSTRLVQLLSSQQALFSESQSTVTWQHTTCMTWLASDRYVTLL